MLLTSLNNSMPSIGEAGLLAIAGYAMIFVGLISLMVVLIALGALFSRKATKAAPAPAAAPAEVPKATAPGTAGELKLHDVEPKTAAMLMAIVANKLGKPLNELRFISIKEVK